MAKPKGNQMMPSDRVRFPRHRARKAERHRDGGGQAAQGDKPVSSAPTVHRETTPTQCKAFRGSWGDS